ncbi:phosphatidylserine decarboxylase [Candidatus Endowatersipora endosymbiont of Watersipora subatra]|uniref:phosphatidylserine decarboxylase n=1 Tax=Candidatus Endowatersipora endosymbiont of Watersipora subatra TaxID=3077946 RepID=UPI00312CB5AE
MSIINSIRSVLTPIHPEGYRFILVLGVITLFLLLIWGPLFWIGLAITIWCTFFFRDPKRIIPVSDDLILSPADGIISSLGSFVPPKNLEIGSEPRLRITIFMNVFNCHINRAPVRGKIINSIYRPGKFLSADLNKASEANEQHSIIIDGPHGPIVCVQIAGLVARRILNFADQGKRFEQGERIGLIRFGSRVDVFLPKGATPLVFLGQTMVAGETILASHGDMCKASPIPRTI